jgi:D-tyrosyl-tRNA(Tyr) deacylase
MNGHGLRNTSSPKFVVPMVRLHESGAASRTLSRFSSGSWTEPPVLVVSQFTLYGDARKGRRPTWQAAAPGPVSEPLYDAVCAELERLGAHVERGRFGADMRVESVNDGPITLVLDTTQ